MADLFKRILRIPPHREIDRANFEGKKVLARFDFNVPIENGKIEDTKRIDLALPTIKTILVKKPAELNIICHLGRPKGRGEEPEFSTAPIARYLAEALRVRFHAKAVETESKNPALHKCYMVGDRIRIFENLRFDKREEENSSAFAKELAQLGDVFVQDAFANIHREHASMSAIQKLLPTYAGMLVKREVNSLFRLLNSPKRPFVAIIGGAKIEDKLPIIEALSKTADTVIVGGKTANDWLLQHKERVKNIYLPTDGVNKNGVMVPINEQTLKAGIFDIGPQTIMLYKSILSSAKTIFWNGNLGLTEEKKFVHGTYEIVRFIAKLKADKIISGGNTAEVVDELKMEGSFNFISSGGGATSDFICGKKLPVLEMLLK